MLVKQHTATRRWYYSKVERRREERKKHHGRGKEEEWTEEEWNNEEHERELKFKRKTFQVLENVGARESEDDEKSGLDSTRLVVVVSTHSQQKKRSWDAKAMWCKGKRLRWRSRKITRLFFPKQQQQRTKRGDGASKIVSYFILRSFVRIRKKIRRRFICENSLT